MGAKQFQVIDQAQLDQIQVNTDQIHTDTAKILNSDDSKYTLFDKDLKVVLPVYDVWTEVLNLTTTEKGYLSSVYLHGGDGGSNFYSGSLQIIVDGIIIHEGASSASYIGGLINLYELGSYNSFFAKMPLSNGIGQINTPKNYPLTDNLAGTVILSKPIYFKSSLIVNIKGSTQSFGYAISLRGGVV